MSSAAIILAGGASRRMGSPKALLLFEGQTFLDRLIENASACCDEVVVVLGHQPDVIRAGITRSAKFVVNERHELGQLTSLQCGLREVDHPVDFVLFTPVDYPAVSQSTYSQLAAAFHPGDVFVVPEFEGKHGHPILFSGLLSFEFLNLPHTAAARDVVHAYRPETRYVPVLDRGVILDIDEPSDYQALLRNGRGS